MESSTEEQTLEQTHDTLASAHEADTYRGIDPRAWESAFEYLFGGEPPEGAEAAQAESIRDPLPEAIDPA